MEEITIELLEFLLVISSISLCQPCIPNVSAMRSFVHQMARVQAVNSLTDQAEEMVLAEIVYK